MPAPAKIPECHPDDPKPKDFVLGSDDSKFTNRTSSVFGSLGMLEQEHIRHVRHSDFNEERSMWKEDPKEEAEGRGQPRSAGIASFSGHDGPRARRGAGFKRPFPSDSRGKPYSPGYRSDPSKWKRYDLSSVPSGDMSEKSNTKAALDFLGELKDRKESDKMDLEESEDSHHIVFKKPSKKSEDTPAAAAAATAFKGAGKIVMQEYEVGNVKKPSRPAQLPVPAAATASSSAAVGLEHLKDSESDSKEVAQDTEGQSVAFKSKFKKKPRGNIRERKTEDDDEA